MTPARRPGVAGLAHTAPAPRPALTDQRFQDLLKDASCFFAQAEDDNAAARQAAIADILALMAYHQLTVEDLA